MDTFNPAALKIYYNDELITSIKRINWLLDRAIKNKELSKHKKVLRKQILKNRKKAFNYAPFTKSKRTPKGYLKSLVYNPTDDITDANAFLDSMREYK